MGHKIVNELAKKLSEESKILKLCIYIPEIISVACQFVFKIYNLMSWLAHAPNRKILPCTTKGPLKLASACTELDPASNMHPSMPD